MLKTTILFLSFFLLLSNLVSSNDEADSDVLTLTQENMDDNIKEHEFVLVKFYAPWCGHCKALAPEYEKAATMLKESGSLVKLGKVDATVHSDLAAKYQIKGYPTLLFFKSGVKSEYNGGRTAETIITWLKKKTGPALSLIESVDALDKLKTQNKVYACLFTSSESSNEYKAISEVADKIGEVEFGLVKDTDLMKKLEKKEGDFVIFKQFDDPEVLYKGDWDSEEIQKFVNAERVALVTEFNPETAQVIFGSHIKYHVLAFSGKKKSDDYAKHIELLSKTAKDLKGKVHVVMIDLDDEESARVADFFSIKAEDAPTFRVLDMKDEMLKFLPEKNEFSSDYITDFANKVLKGEVKPHLKSADEPATWNDEPVKVLVAKTFKDRAIHKDKAVFVKFYAPWCGHCKAIAPVWDNLAKDYENNSEVLIAKMDSTENELEDVKIQGFPTLKFSPKGSTEFIDYSGDRSLEALKQFIDSNGKDVKKAAGEEDTHDEL